MALLPLDGAAKPPAGRPCHLWLDCRGGSDESDSMRRPHIPLAPGAGSRTTWLIGVASFVLLTCLAAWRAYPPLPRTLALQISFPEGIAGRIEPLVSAGAFEAADFFDIRYDGPTTARFGYDYWGEGGPVSEPFTIVPGRVYALELEMAALAETSPFPTRPKAPFRVVLDGRELMRAQVSYHQRASTEIYFGENPIGGTTAGVRFRGKLATGDGRELRGGPEAYFSRRTQFVTWFARYPSHLFAIAIVSVGLALGLPWLVAWCAVQRTRIWFAAATLMCAVVFTWVLTGGSWKLISAESFGNFYDYQALSLLHGHLDVPEGALSGEAFIFDGKCYGYFGPTPAIMRIPLLLLGIGFGHLSRAFMLIDYVAALVAAYALLGYATRVVAGADQHPSRFTTVVFTASVGLGSTLFFVAGRAYIYHEAIICGVALALWSTYASLRFLEARASRWWIGAMVCGTAAVHARPPIGFFALSLLGTVAAVHLGRAVASRQGWKKPIAIGLVALAAIGSYNGVSYLKFKTIEGCPLRYNVQYTPERLAKIDGRQFHWSNVPYSLDSYFLKVTLGFGRDFPYFHMRGLDSRDYPRAKMDLTEPMAGVPYAMPALFVFSLVGIIAAALPRRTVRLPVVAVLIAAVPMTLAMFAAIAVSHRYTADFLGVFVAVAAFGLAWIDRGSERWRTTARVLSGTLAAFGAVITVALTLNFQGTMVWGQPKETLEHYQRLRDRVEQATRWLHKI